ncbi:sigma factor-like helix-turn-helix DNA-binding protein, partial [Massilicoli timonensis]
LFFTQCPHTFAQRHDITQVEIAQELGISQAQVSRLEKNAIAALKKQFE